MQTLKRNGKLEMKTVAVILASALAVVGATVLLAYWTRVPERYFSVRTRDGEPVVNAHIRLTYDSSADSSKVITNENGIGVLNKGWGYNYFTVTSGATRVTTGKRQIEDAEKRVIVHVTMPKLVEIPQREVIFCDENGDPLKDVNFSFSKIGPGIAFPGNWNIAENGTIEIPKDIEFPINITG